MMFAQGSLRHVYRWSNQDGCDRDEHRQRNGYPERTLDAHRATTDKEPAAVLPGGAESGCVTSIHLLQLEPESHKEPINLPVVGQNNFEQMDEYRKSAPRTSPRPVILSNEGSEESKDLRLLLSLSVLRI
jgi:hypothetical protein